MSGSLNFQLPPGVVGAIIDLNVWSNAWSILDALRGIETVEQLRGPAAVEVDAIACQLPEKSRVISSMK